MHNRWGPERRDDFWTSLAHGEIETPELRAMMLLESVCDEYRFTLYSFAGEMPAMGNVTGTMYVIQKSGGVVELDSNGQPSGRWCISIGPHSPVPGTDNVVVLKAMIEGEENEFMRIGNRSNFQGGKWPDAPGVVSPHTSEWIPRDQWALALKQGMIEAFPDDLFELPDTIQVLEVEHQEKLDNAALRMARQFGAMQRASEDWIMPDRYPVEWFGMRMGNGLMEMRNRNDGRRVRYDPQAAADYDVDIPSQALDLYGGEAARGDLDELRQMHEREERAFLGEVHGIPRNETDRLRQAIAQQVQREINGGGLDVVRGIRLRDGTMLNWDPREAQDVFMRTGIVVADEIHRMNNEGYNAEMIRWAMVEYFGVHQVFEGPNIQYGQTAGQYLTANQVGLDPYAVYDAGGEPVFHGVGGPVVRPVGNGQFQYL